MSLQVRKPFMRNESTVLWRTATSRSLGRSLPRPEPHTMSAAPGARDACWSCLLRVKAEALQPKAGLLSQMLLSDCPGSDKKVGLHLQRRIRRLRSREEEDLGHPLCIL